MAIFSVLCREAGMVGVSSARGWFVFLLSGGGTPWGESFTGQRDLCRDVKALITTYVRDRCARAAPANNQISRLDVDCFATRAISNTCAAMGYMLNCILHCIFPFPRATSHHFYLRLRSCYAGQVVHFFPFQFHLQTS